MNILKDAHRYREIILAATANLNDKIASEAPILFPNLIYDNSLISAGTRINWNGILKRAVVDLWATIENNPDNAPFLWEDISYREGYRIIPEIITVTSAFVVDEIGWWKNEKYQSLFTGNVYTPEEYPEGWLKL